MIPGRSILQHSKVVCECATPGNWTLSQGHAILVVVVILTKAMPVDDSSFIVEVVGNMDDDSVSPASFNQGSGVCSVEETGLFGGPVWSDGMLVNVKVVLSRVSDTSLCLIRR